jgi:3-deoxy-7-phosphoheptulonate synthase
MRTRDVRVEGYRPLVPPAVLLDELPLPEEGSRAIAAWRREIAAILDRDDDRLLVVAGPCSVHDVAAALEYAGRLRSLSDRVAADVRVVMRVYFEKPRTTVGWKGLINDPNLDGSFRINEGIRMARKLLLDVVALGMPAGCEFLDPISPQYTSDLVAWGAIGARTTESQVHRELASGMSMPIGFKNGTGGTVQIAIDAVRAAAYPHRFLGVTEQGLAAIVSTRGNADCHLILRGGARGPNYRRADVVEAMRQLEAAGVAPRVMIDASHGNSERDHRKQLDVTKDVGSQIADGDRGIVGVMIESFLVEGRQELVERDRLVFGQSVTDACLGWDDTVRAIDELAAAVRARRARQRERVASTSR